MKRVIACIGLMLAIVAFTDSFAARAQQGASQVCPAGYSLIGKICISDTSGDIVFPQKNR
jgi:hypothetical protein